MDDIDTLMADDLDAKASALWEQGVPSELGNAEFERLYGDHNGRD